MKFNRYCYSHDARSSTTRGAFTLLELLVVTGLLVAMATLSGPSLRRSLGRAAHRRAVDDVCQFLTEARSRALSRARPYLVEFDSRRTQIDLFEVRFDEADARAFEPGASMPGKSSRQSSRAVDDRTAPQSSPQQRGESANPIHDKENFADGMSRPELAWIASLELPAGSHCRDLRRESKKNLGEFDANTFVTDADAAPEQNALPQSVSQNDESLDESLDDAFDSTTLGDATRHTVRLVFDAMGKTADAKWEVGGREGYSTEVVVAGFLGSVTRGQTQHRANRVLNGAKESMESASKPENSL